MKVTVDRKAMLDAIATVSKAAGTRTPRAYQTCVKVTAPAGGPVHLSCQDGTVSIAMSVGAVTVDTPCVEGVLFVVEKLRAILSAEIDPTVSIEVGEGIGHVRSTDAHYKMFLHPVADWPATVPPEEPTTLRMPALELGRYLRIVRGSAGSESSRYSIAGVLVKIVPNVGLHFVTTDGRRLAMIVRKEKIEGPSHSYIIPIKSVALIEQLCALEGDGTDATIATLRFDRHGKTVDIQFNEGATGLARIQTLLMEGAFPPYEDVFPKDNDLEIIVDRDRFMAALKLAAIMTNEESRGVSFGIKGSELVMKSSAPEMGDAMVKYPIIRNSGDKGEITIGLNPGFVMETMRHADAPEIRMSFKKPGTPLLVNTGISKHVIMPVTLLR